MESKQVAQTIIEQIKASDRTALMSWGARQFIALNEEQIGEKLQLGGLQMTVSGLLFKGKVLVRLMANDTYTVEIGNVRAGAWKVKATVEGVFCDELEYQIDSLIERKAA